MNKYLHTKLTSHKLYDITTNTLSNCLQYQNMSVSYLKWYKQQNIPIWEKQLVLLTCNKYKTEEKIYVLYTPFSVHISMSNMLASARLPTKCLLKKTEHRNNSLWNFWYKF